MRHCDQSLEAFLEFSFYFWRCCSPVDIPSLLVRQTNGPMLKQKQEYINCHIFIKCSRMQNVYKKKKELWIILFPSSYTCLFTAIRKFTKTNIKIELLPPESSWKLKTRKNFSVQHVFPNVNIHMENECIPALFLHSKSNLP